MIFVTVGTHDQGFDRLVKAADELATLVEGEPVLIQTGCSDYTPIHADYFRYSDSQGINKLIQQARIVISQASAGTIIAVFLLNKPLIIVPRLRKFNENWTDHQMELAKALHEQGRAFAILSEQLSGQILKEALNKVPQFTPILDGSTGLIQALRNQLNTWEQHRNKSHIEKR